LYRSNQNLTAALYGWKTFSVQVTVSAVVNRSKAKDPLVLLAV
jgi:hypothetical protein